MKRFNVAISALNDSGEFVRFADVQELAKEVLPLVIDALDGIPYTPAVKSSVEELSARLTQIIEAA